VSHLARAALILLSLRPELLSACEACFCSASSRDLPLPAAPRRTCALEERRGRRMRSTRLHACCRKAKGAETLVTCAVACLSSLLPKRLPCVPAFPVRLCHHLVRARCRTGARSGGRGAGEGAGGARGNVSGCVALARLSLEQKAARRVNPREESEGHQAALILDPRCVPCWRRAQGGAEFWTSFLRNLHAFLYLHAIAR